MGFGHLILLVLETIFIFPGMWLTVQPASTIDSNIKLYGPITTPSATVIFPRMQDWENTATLFPRRGRSDHLLLLKLLSAMTWAKIVQSSPISASITTPAVCTRRQPPPMV